MVDAFLLEQFPGKTLDELDSMDWARYNRAIAARVIARAEDARKSFNSGNIKAKDIPQIQWKRIRENDALLHAFHSNKE